MAFDFHEPHPMPQARATASSFPDYNSVRDTSVSDEAAMDRLEDRAKVLVDGSMKTGGPQ